MVCIDCGNDYKYDPNRPLGASTSRCPTCRKKDTAKQKTIALMMIAGHGVLQCRKCGYRNCSSALVLKDGIAFLDEASSQEEKEHRAKSQFILCLNCNAEIQSNQVTLKVTNAKVYPIEVEFYAREVRVVSTRIEAVVNYNSDYQDVEVTTDGSTAERVSRPKARAIEQSAIDVPTVQVD